jgi:hypothetical protein
MAVVTATSWSVQINGGGNYVICGYAEYYASYPATWAVGLTGIVGYTGISNTMNAPWLIDSHADSVYFSGFDSYDYKGGSGTSEMTAATGFSNVVVELYLNLMANTGPVSSSTNPYLTFGTSYLNTSSLSDIYPACTVYATPLGALPANRIYSQAVRRSYTYFKDVVFDRTPRGLLVPKVA